MGHSFPLSPFTLRTDLVHLQDLKARAHLGQQLLGGAAVRAVALREDHGGILVNEALGLSFRGGHGGGRRRRGREEKAAEELRYGGGRTECAGERDDGWRESLVRESRCETRR
jgi:hypothetical protein